VGFVLSGLLRGPRPYPSCGQEINLFQVFSACLHPTRIISRDSWRPRIP
jgi:hypothetical protein